jgi:hypothetical protein
MTLIEWPPHLVTAYDKQGVLRTYSNPDEYIKE